jgi:5-methylcytosine-specific restriction protein A
MSSLFPTGGSSSLRFNVGATYHRKNDLHEQFDGQEQGGISTPSDYALILLFTSARGDAYGYRDEFREDGTFWYTGEGQVGDMEMKRGNKAIRSHRSTGKELHLFTSLGDGRVRYVGQAFYLDHHWEERPDVNGDPRRAIVFELEVETEASPQSHVRSAEGEVREASAPTDSPRPLADLSLPELREAALRRAAADAPEDVRRQNIRRRSEAIRKYVFARANGICEGCEREAPFVTENGRPYLEAHHIRRLADNGPDHPRWVIALCPTCHRKVHHGREGDAYNEALAERVGVIEG